MANRLAGSFRFSLMIDNVSYAQFNEVNGISSEIELETIKEGGQNDYVIQLPSTVRFPRLVLKRGMIDMDLLEWYLQYRKVKKIIRKNITVSVLGGLGKTNHEERVYDWNFNGAYPVKWSGPSLNSMSSATAFETIEFVHRGIYR